MITAALGLRVVAALRGGAVLVSRPRGVVHFHDGVLTASGRSVPANARPYCGARSRRLRVVARDVDQVGPAVAGRRFCRSCTLRLPARLGTTCPDLQTRDDWQELYDDLTVADLRLAASWARTVDETYQVQRVLMVVHGPKPTFARTPERRALAAAYDAAADRRRHIEAAARTPEEVAAVHEARAVELHNNRLVARSRNRDTWIDRLGEKERAGRYLTSDEREALRSA